MDDFTHIYGAGRPVLKVRYKPSMLYTLEQYKRHASRFGPEQVYETAHSHLSLKDLIELVHHLRSLPTKDTAHFRTKSGWLLTKEQREDLAERMFNVGYKDKAILRVTKG